MRKLQFEVPVAPQPPKAIRIILPKELLHEVESLASINGVDLATVIEHAVIFALATRKSKSTRTKRTINH
jgi:hypothetical protein